MAKGILAHLSDEEVLRRTEELYSSSTLALKATLERWVKEGVISDNDRRDFMTEWDEIFWDQIGEILG